MKQTLQQVLFKDKTLWLVADPGKRDGPLCNVPEEYEHGRVGYAHLRKDGKITRFHENIGTLDDLEFTGLCQDVEPSDDARSNIINSLCNMGLL